MADLTTPSYAVYTGIWTNSSYGSITGLTLTLDPTNANLLIALIAFFVTMVSVHLWKLVSFFVHAYFSTKDDRDVLHHQRQAVIRNTRSPGSTALTLAHMTWTWRKAPRGFRKRLPLFFFALLFTVLIATAAGFSSRLVRDDDDVLLRGENCGIQKKETVSNLTQSITEVVPWLSDLGISGSNYATQCYSETSSVMDRCQSMVKVKQDIEITTNAPCPFGNLCIGAGNSIILDSGIFESHKDLGLNSPKESRFGVRNTWQCAPIETEGRKSQQNISTTRSFTLYTYNVPAEGWPNTTWKASNDVWTDFRHSQTQGASQTDYSIGFVSRLPNFEASGDITFAFLSANAIGFVAKTTDPWYRASRRINNLWQPGSPNQLDVYGHDEPASPLACLSKIQFCNYTQHGLDRCSPMGSSKDITDRVLDYVNSIEKQSSRSTWLYPGHFFPDAVLATLGIDSLLSRRSLADGLQGPLPDNQWEQDVTHWFRISLAIDQLMRVNLVAGNLPHLRENLVVRPNNTWERNICQSQKIKSTAYISFTMLGLLLVVSIGISIIALSLGIESIVRCCHRRTRRFDPYTLAEWTTNGTLHLQTLAYEELGMGEWTGCNENIPYTKDPVQILRPLDSSDLDHPRILLSSKADDTKSEIGSANNLDEKTPVQQENTDSSTQETKGLQESDIDGDNPSEETLSGGRSHLACHEPRNENTSDSQVNNASGQADNSLETVSPISRAESDDVAPYCSGPCVDGSNGRHSPVLASSNAR